MVRRVARPRVNTGRLLASLASLLFLGLAPKSPSRRIGA